MLQQRNRVHRVPWWLYSGWFGIIWPLLPEHAGHVLQASHEHFVVNGCLLLAHQDSHPAITKHRASVPSVAVVIASNRFDAVSLCLDLPVQCVCLWLIRANKTGIRSPGISTEQNQQTSVEWRHPIVLLCIHIYGQGESNISSNSNWCASNWNS